MAAPQTSDELLQVIRKSGLLDEPRLEEYLQKHQKAGTLSPDPRKLASHLVRDGLITFFQAEQYLLGKWRGFTIGRYKLLERIGFGSMGPVFLSEHLYMKRRVAIKILPPAKAEEPAALGRFYREARASGILDHPHIVRTHDIDQDGNLHFLVMEYIDGSSFLEIIKKTGPMDFLRATHYIAHAAAALQHAHTAGIIHRDVKPGNVMVDRDGSAKLLDLGLAKFYRDINDMLTVKYDENNVLGTADYVAPEQTVNSHKVDTRADIYSLGATFYFLLAGHPLFPEGIVSQKLLWHRTREPKSIREIRPDVPPAIAEVLERMLIKDMNDRYQTMREVVSAFIPWTSQPIEPPPVIEMPQLSPAAMEIPSGTPTDNLLSAEPAASRKATATAVASPPVRPAAAPPRPTAPPPSAPASAPAGPGPGFQEFAPIPLNDAGGSPSSLPGSGYIPRSPADRAWPRNGTLPTTHQPTGTSTPTQPANPPTSWSSRPNGVGHPHRSLSQPPPHFRAQDANANAPDNSLMRMLALMLIAAFLGSILAVFLLTQVLN